MEWKITEGTDPDFAALCDLLDGHLNDSVGGETQRKHYNRHNLRDDIHDVVLAYEEGRAIACGAFKHYEPGTAEIKRVFVRPECRGTGLSKELMRRLEQRAAERGYRTLVLETGVELVAAMGLYSGLGYERTENYGPYRDLPASVCMRKQL